MSQSRPASPVPIQHEGPLSHSEPDATEDVVDLNSYWDLTELEEKQLHQHLLSTGGDTGRLDAAEDVHLVSAGASAGDPCQDCGDDDEKEDHQEVGKEALSDAELLHAHAARARTLGVLPSVWYEVSQRTAKDRELFLDVEAAPRHSGGPSSSSTS